MTLRHGGTELVNLLLGLLAQVGGNTKTMGGLAKLTEAGGNLVGQILQLLGPVVGGTTPIATFSTSTGTDGLQLHQGILLVIIAVANVVAIISRHHLHPFRFNHGLDAGQKAVGNTPDGEVTDDPSLVVPVHGGIELVVETIQLGNVARLALDDAALDGVELGRHLLHLGGLAGVLAAELLQPGTEDLDVAVGPAQHVGPDLDLLVQNRLGRPLGRDFGFGG